jgi:aspartyl-tRNA(Asn)/glutamyl-tRNA(Gln) amidotransferase subunit C
MEVSREQVLKMAKLARLELSDADVEKMASSLDKLVGYMAMLKQIDLKDVEPMLAVDTSTRPLRPDEPHVSLPKEKTFANAPSVNMDHFSIPKVIGG